MANKKNKKNKKRNNVAYLKSIKKQAFKHNGIKYQRSNDTVLIKIRSEINNKYIGVKIGRNGNSVVFEDIFPTNQQDGFIFMLDKDIFNKFGILTVIEMLKKEGISMSRWDNDHFIPEII